jgi:hypothetical protein
MLLNVELVKGKIMVYLEVVVENRILGNLILGNLPSLLLITSRKRLSK